MHAMPRVGLLLCLCLGLAACPRPVQPPSPSPSVPPTEPSQTTPLPRPTPEVSGATMYQIDPQASDLNILVYRGGRLARLGHNHVMSSKSLSGRVWMHPELTRSGFEISFPVAELIVDDADARRAAGPEFPGEIPEGDKQGTRKNMLGADVLDAERHARVEVTSALVAGSIQAPEIRALVTIKQITREVAVPLTVSVNGDRLTATGDFSILQTYFGIKPFSVALGALEVKDLVEVRFKIVAVKR
jgi:hypothetical protein